MRESAERLGDVGIDKFASESLGRARAIRLAALADDPDTPLFFGRLDQRDGGEVFHVGRRHVRDEAGDPMVIDWRAGVSRAFYRASSADPMGVRRRRRFGYAGGTLTSFEDEWLADGRDAAGPDASDTAAAGQGPSRILLEEIERPRVGPMRDIVATIQPDQDDLVRAPLDDSVCVQGAPGTGKTAVGLHRAAFLLYTYPERLRRSGVLVIGPNRAFLSYVAGVLPALGEVGVDQTSIEDLVSDRLRVRVRGQDTATAAVVKGDVRLAEVVRRALYGRVRRPERDVVVTVGSRRYRVPPEQLRRWVDDLRRGDIRYAAARERLQALVAYDVRRQMEAHGATPTDRAVEKMARSAPVRAAIDEVWPQTDAATVIFELLADPSRLAAAAQGLLDDDEQRTVCWTTPPRGKSSARWSLADAFLIDEAADLIERTPSYGHVIVDEAQDLSPMQCRAVARRSTLGSLTVLGDLAQGTAPWATADWQVTLSHLGKPAARVEPLTRGYRVPQQVLVLANRLLPSLATGLSPAVSVRQGRDALRLRRVEPADAPSALGDACVREVRRALDAEGSIGVIVADAGVARVRRALADVGIGAELLGDATEGAEIAEPCRVSIVPATLAKGLEYDSVIVVEPADIVAAEPRGLHRLYVVLTRAVSRLCVVYAKPLPELLTA
jgi:DNA helicase IV